MASKTCLLVSDDPDDHQSFSEAVSELSQESIVVVILDCMKALQALVLQRVSPEMVILDLTMHGIRMNTFTKAYFENEALKKIPLILYGDEGMIHQMKNDPEIHVFRKNFNYAELKDFLAPFIAN